MMRTVTDRTDRILLIGSTIENLACDETLSLAKAVVEEA